MAGQLAPAVGGDFAIFCVQSDDDLTRECTTGIMQEAGVLHSSGTDDHVGDSVIEKALDGVKVTNSATELYRNLFNIKLFCVFAHGGKNRLDRRLIFRLAGKRTV